MTTSIRFDTLDYAKKLESAGLSAAEAKLQAQLLADVLGRSVAFPEDLLILGNQIANKLESQELKIENRLATISGEISLLKWMTGTAIGLMFTLLMRMFFH